MSEKIGLEKWVMGFKFELWVMDDAQFKQALSIQNLVVAKNKDEMVSW